jgi:hypothetical protein
LDDRNAQHDANWEEYDEECHEEPTGHYNWDDDYIPAADEHDRDYSKDVR